MYGLRIMAIHLYTAKNQIGCTRIRIQTIYVESVYGDAEKSNTQKISNDPLFDRNLGDFF